MALITVFDEFKKEVAACLHADVRELEIPPNPTFGDIAYPCFTAAKREKKDPKSLAAELGKKINIKGKNLIEKFEIRGPYINFFINWDSFNRRLFKRVNKNYGKGKRKKKLGLVEYSSPNPVHPWHFGTIRSTLIGESLARILDFSGWRVKRICYINDVGKQGAFLLCGYLENPKKPIGKPDVWLGRIYFEAYKKFQKDEEAVHEVLRKYEIGDKKIREIGRRVFQWCLDGFAENWNLFGIKFDHIMWESKFIASGKRIVDELEKRGFIFESEGAKVLHLEPYNLSSTIIQRSDGTQLYLARDVGFARWKNRYNPDLNLYVVAEDQRLHFRQLFKVLELIGYEALAKKSLHLPFGMVTLGGKKMSSRSGRVVLFDDLLTEGKKRAVEEIQRRWPDLSSKEMKTRAESVALAAIAYFLLKYSPEKAVKFDWTRALRFEGNTGPYLQYTHARACSILRKAKAMPKKYEPGMLTKREEIAVIRLLAEFPAAVARAAEELRPHIIAHYAYDLCEAFNSFYHSLRVLQAENEKLRRARLALVSAVRTVLCNCLDLLVIPIIERM